jgi:hypothetical protein
VKDLIRGRELFTLDALGAKVQGTCHLPHDEVSGTQGELRGEKVTGILLLSGLLSPRAVTGDSMVYWADSFAKRGYRSSMEINPVTLGAPVPAYVSSGK